MTGEYHYSFEEDQELLESRDLLGRIADVVRPVYNLVRPYTPRKYYWASGIAVPRGHLFDINDEMEYKPLAIDRIKEYVNEGDTVVDIATGYGIFALVARRQGGEVHTYEGTAEYVVRAKKLFDLLDYQDIDTNHAIVGDTSRLFGAPKRVREVDPADLPECDVLLLDCEGAGIEIIHGIDPKPDTILIETHPPHGKPTGQVRSWLKRFDYEIVDEAPYETAQDFLVGRRRR